MSTITTTLDADGNWIATYDTPDPAYRAGLIGKGRTKELALYDLQQGDESMRRLALRAAGEGGAPATPATVTLTFGEVYDALVADGWAVVGGVPGFDRVAGTIGRVLRKAGRPDFLAVGSRNELVGPVYLAAICSATGLDPASVGG